MFGSVLTCAKSAHVFQKLSYSFCGLCLSLSPLITLPQTVRLFYVSLRSQAPQQQYTVLSFLRCEGMSTVTNWSLHVHNGITLCTYLSQAHRPIALHCMHYGITLWAYLSEPLVKDSHKRSMENTIPCAPSHVITLPLRTCYGEVYGNIAREENGWLSHGIRKFITLLTFELSNFRENGFFSTLYPLIPLVGRLKAREGRVEKTDRQTDRQTDTQDNYRNPRCACAPRVNNSYLNTLNMFGGRHKGKH